MVKWVKNEVLLYVLICGLAFGNTVNGNSDEEPSIRYESSDKYEGKITITARVVKDVYGPNEPVPIVIGIANHDSKSIYLVTDTLDILGSGAIVKDANGVRIQGVSLSRRPKPIPLSHYIKKDGKTSYVQPISEIKGPSLVLCLTPDALSKHHGLLDEGTYYLTPGPVTVIHEISGIINRTDVSHRLWSGPETETVRVLYKLEPIKIKIRKQVSKVSDTTH